MHKNVKNQLRQSVPKSSFITEMCCNFKNLYSWYNSDHFYCKFVLSCLNRNKYPDTSIASVKKDVFIPVLISYKPGYKSMKQ